eukprot:CAMPEP_0172607478 /NCGR_PEP_ID=MMETSP1068-20121228/27657_1 /TAXON_ID=35684 /ORGANISM="Pseudopedinella elastica, Strain CCMP716" /LENGTH=98 /DNA_ID=CAMNT_0013410499 /DNA_START=393 /DNA_END=690 /DNA_ORIENTATION=-
MSQQRPQVSVLARPGSKTKSAPGLLMESNPAIEHTSALRGRGIHDVRALNHRVPLVTQVALGRRGRWEHPGPRRLEDASKRERDPCRGVRVEGLVQLR